MNYEQVIATAGLLTGISFSCNNLIEMFGKDYNGQDTDCKYSTTPVIRINMDGGPSGYAENPNNWNFL
jgi:hypothetical protein